MMECSRGRVRLFRNNVGALQNARGEWVQYGLAPGSADLIGWVDGRFAAIEVKSARGIITDAQNRFIATVRDAGGVAGVARSVEDAHRILRRI